VAFAAIAQQPDLSPVTSLKVDLKQVVQLGTEELGLHYVAFPIASEDAISFASAKKLDELLQQYPGPVLVHCASGNRVGALLALRASLDGADDEQALKLGREGGLTRLEDLVRKRLAEDDK
jgi:protein tyrosine phosphatase (PTP) superfamily phosphohydrolase (DUF442 family)